MTPPGVRCGCDLEQLEPRSEALIADHFTPAEIARIHAAATPEATVLATNLTWSTKEAALKLLRTGLRRDTRSVEVEWSEPPSETTDEPDWQPLRVTGREATDPAPLPGWWLPLPGAVLTLVTVPSGPPPRLARAPYGCRRR